MLAGLSDIIAQKLAAKAPVNWRRTAAMAAFGGIWSGPSNHFWQARLGCFWLGDARLRTLSQVPRRAHLDCTAAACAGVCGARVPRPLGANPPDTEGACYCCRDHGLLGFLSMSTALSCLHAVICPATLKLAVGRTGRSGPGHLRYARFTLLRCNTCDKHALQMHASLTVLETAGPVA